MSRAQAPCGRGLDDPGKAQKIIIFGRKNRYLEAISMVKTDIAKYFRRFVAFLGS